MVRRAILAIVVADLVTSTCYAGAGRAQCGSFAAAVFDFVQMMLQAPFTLLHLASPGELVWPTFALFAILALAFFLLQRSALSRRQLVTIILGLFLLAALAGYGSYYSERPHHFYKVGLRPFGHNLCSDGSMFLTDFRRLNHLR